MFRKIEKRIWRLFPLRKKYTTINYILILSCVEPKLKDAYRNTTYAHFVLGCISSYWITRVCPYQYFYDMVAVIYISKSIPQPQTPPFAAESSAVLTASVGSFVLCVLIQNLSDDSQCPGEAWGQVTLTRAQMAASLHIAHGSHKVSLLQMSSLDP